MRQWLPDITRLRTLTLRPAEVSDKRTLSRNELSATKVDGRTSRHQHRRPELLAAAAEYILEHGVADLSLRSIAVALGVTHATLLRHFGTKEALITDVITFIRQGIAAKLTALGHDTVDIPPAVAMRTMWRQLCDPAERRQFVLLFELVAMQAGDPDRFGSLAPMLIDDFLTRCKPGSAPTGNLVARRATWPRHFWPWSAACSSIAVSGDQQRVDAGLERYIATVT